jgi:glutamate dehydrogenase/leucine dehydrogenase
MLEQKGIIVIPDILANSGGVAVSYFEWKQNIDNQKWQKQDVFHKLKEKMDTATSKVHAISQKNNVSLRTAAYMLALENIAAATKHI